MNSRSSFLLLLAVVAVAMWAMTGSWDSGDAPAVPPVSGGPQFAELREPAPEGTCAGGGADVARRPVPDEEIALRRADRLARGLGLGVADAAALRDVLSEEHERRVTALTQASRQGNLALANAGLRESLDDIRCWKTAQLQRLFGAERAEWLMRR